MNLGFIKRLRLPTPDCIRCSIVLALFCLLAPLKFAFGSDSLKVGDPAPTFVLKDLNGQNVYLRDYCGELRDQSSSVVSQVVILSFFATWCLPCQKEIPILEKFYSDFRQEPIRVFLIAVGEDKIKIQSFVSAKGIALPVLIDGFTTTAKNYGVADKFGRVNLPQLYIIDKKGRVQFHQIGLKAEDPLRDLLLKNVGKLLN